MKVHFITTESGDWVTMYIDGEYITGGHSIPITDVAAAILGPGNVTDEEWPGDTPLSTWNEDLYIELSGGMENLEYIDSHIRPRIKDEWDDYCDCGEENCSICYRED